MKLITIVGETASGKSSLAHKLAKLFNGEIICADSRTIYAGMDIGTAKPSKVKQKEVQYHMLDIKNPDQEYNVAQFKNDATHELEAIGSKNKLPIMVGGTGLFIDSILFDFTFGQKPNPAKREQLNTMSLAELQAEAEKTGEILDKNLLSNKRHLIRLLETGNVRNQDKKLREDTLVVGLKLPRTELRKRIEQRTEAMFRAGLRKEVDELQEQYGWDSEAMTGIGYREFKPYYKGEISMGEVKKAIVKNTLKYAKRQRTWFKRNQYIEWFEEPEYAIKRVKSFVEQ